MKFLLCMGLFVLSQTWLHAQQPLELKLWPEGMPNDNGMTCQEENGVLYVAEPTLTVYPATEGNGMAIVACPGGGYGKLAMDHEGKDMAAWFNNQGITYAVLKYRMPNDHKEVPLSDSRQAMRILRHRAGEWQLKRIGIMGFSAGGHLASTVATHFEDEESHPDFQILFYPVISMDPEYTHRGTHDNLLGKQPAKEEEDDFSNELHVDGNTPPGLHPAQQRRPFCTRSPQPQLLHGSAQAPGSGYPAHLPHRRARMGLPGFVHLQKRMDGRTGKMAQRNQ